MNIYFLLVRPRKLQLSIPSDRNESVEALYNARTKKMLMDCGEMNESLLKHYKLQTKICLPQMLKSRRRMPAIIHRCEPTAPAIVHTYRLYNFPSCVFPRSRLLISSVVVVCIHFDITTAFSIEVYLCAGLESTPRSSSKYMVNFMLFETEDPIP
jgi:hypothetical protein